MLEDMAEVRCAIARRHQVAAQADPLQRGFLERHHVGRRGLAGVERVPFHVQQRGGDHFAEAVPLVELAGPVDRLDQLVRDNLAGFVMAGIALQHLGHGGEVLVELAGEFHPVARGVGARERGVFLIGEDAVQRMAEFVEHRGHVVPGRQRGLAGGGRSDVLRVGDDRLQAQQVALLDEVAHPRTATLALAAERVEVEQRLFLTIVIDGVDLHIRVVGGNVGALLEGQAVKLLGHVEHAVFQHVVDHEVLLDLLVIEGVALRTHLAGIILPVPRGELEGLAILLQAFLQHGGFAFLRGAQGGHHVGHETDGGLRIGYHAVVHLPAGVTRLAEQLGAAVAQRDHLADQRQRAGLARLVAADAGTIQPFAHVAIVQLGQLRHAGGVAD